MHVTFSSLAATAAALWQHQIHTHPHPSSDSPISYMLCTVSNTRGGHFAGHPSLMATAELTPRHLNLVSQRDSSEPDWPSAADVIVQNDVEDLYKHTPWQTLCLSVLLVFQQATKHILIIIKSLVNHLLSS